MNYRYSVRKGVQKIKTRTAIVLSALAIAVSGGAGLSLFSSQPAYAATTWSVSSSGGTCTTPDYSCSTIQSAINAADSGDTINVAAGNYTERIWITKAVNLLGADKATTTIMGITEKDSVIGVYSVSGPMTISGFTIDANNYPSYAGGGWESGIYVYGSSQVTIEQNNIINFKADGVTLGSGSNDNVVRNNVITGSADGSNSGVNIYDNSVNNTIGGVAASDGNTILLATGGSGSLYDILLSGAISGDNTVQNNTIDGGTRAVEQDGGVSGTTTISNNTVGGTTSPTFAGVYLNGGSATISGNTLINTVRPIEFQGATNNVTISGNTINGSVYDGINVGYASGTKTITNNTIYNIPSAYGIHIRPGNSNVVISGNEIYGSYSGILTDSTVTGTQITNNDIHDNTYGSIYINNASGTIATLTGNTISNNPRGIEANAGGGTIVAYNNNLVNNTYGGLFLYSSGTLAFSCNWWGDSTGPNVNGGGPGSGALIMTNGQITLTYQPWLISQNGPCIGGNEGYVVTNKDQCKKDGWQTVYDASYKPFKNQGACVSFVASNGKSVH